MCASWYHALARKLIPFKLIFHALFNTVINVLFIALLQLLFSFFPTLNICIELFRAIVYQTRKMLKIFFIFIFVLIYSIDLL